MWTGGSALDIAVVGTGRGARLPGRRITVEGNACGVWKRWRRGN